jgi:ABC-type nitrate/sulfonate/bicarbonate transport system ATPase subunit
MKSSTPSAISIQHLSLSRGGKKLYDDFSLEIAPHSVNALIAPSGSGKTTLLAWIAGVLVYENAESKGTLLFDNKNESPRISFLFQEPRLIPGISIFQNVMLPLLNVMDKTAAEQRAEYFIHRVSLFWKKNVYPCELSGGERQRAAAARAFAYPSGILLMDEPFQSQDLRIKNKLIETLETLIAEEGRTVIFVTHDIEEAVSLGERLIVMDGSPLSVRMDTLNDKKNKDTLVRTVRDLVVNNKTIDYNK